MGKDIFIIQSTSYPVNDNLMELLILTDACKRASAHSITAVVPYYAYARQDRKTRGREPISAKLVANLMTTAGVTRVVTVDLHAGQIQGFFDIPVDHLAAAPVLAGYFREQEIEDLVVVSPDLGGVTRARISGRLPSCADRHHRKAPALSRLCGGHESHRRCRGEDGTAHRRYRRYGGVALRGEQRRLSSAERSAYLPHARMRS